MTAHLLIAILLVAILTALGGRRRSRRLRAWGAPRRSHSLRYELYLRSPLWRVRRRLWILGAHGRCEDCRRWQRPLTIHHLTYRRLGRERRGDVRVLCWGCHQLRHSHPGGRP